MQPNRADSNNHSASGSLALHTGLSGGGGGVATLCGQALRAFITFVLAVNVIIADLVQGNTGQGVGTVEPIAVPGAVGVLISAI